MTDDIVDPRRARRLAWQWSKPGEPVADERVEAAIADAHREEGSDGGRGPGGDSDDGAESAPATPEEAAIAAAQREAARRTAGEIAGAANRLWASTDRAAIAAGLEQLVERIGEMGLRSAAMTHHPLEQVRLARLLVRHWTSLSEEAHEQSLFAFFFLSPEHAEIPDLLEESARFPDEAVFSHLFLAFDEEPGLARHAARLSSLLGRVIAERPDAAARSVAVRWLAMAPHPSAVPLLRTTLRDPDALLRWRALDVLLKLPEGSLREEDLLFLLDEAVHRPPQASDDPEDDESIELIDEYPQALATAVIRMRPPGGLEPTRRMAEGDVPDTWLRDSFGRDWGIKTLAAAYPEAAAPLVDELVRSDSQRNRFIAIAAAGRFPDAMAAPRLRAAALDGSPEIAEWARDTWLERFGAPLQVDVLDLLPPSLRPAAPGARFQSRLAVLRGTSQEARLAMAEVLLGEPPDDENLALLAIALGDDALWHYPDREGIPDSREAWGRALASRHGPRAVEVLALWARRQPAGDGNEWWMALEDLASDETFTAEQLAPAQQAALDWLQSPDWDGERFAITLLDTLGAPASSRDALLSIVERPELPWLTRHTTARILNGWPADEIVDGRLDQLAAELRPAGEWRSIEVLLHAAIPRGREPAIELAESLLDDPDPEIPGNVRTVGARLLYDHGYLPASFVRRALAKPEHPTFDAACHLIFTRPRGTTLRLLQAALDSDARGGAATAEALHLLIFKRLLDANDRRIPALLGRVPDTEVPGLLFCLLDRKARLRPLDAALESVFISSNPEVTRETREILVSSLLQQRGGPRRMAQYRPRIVDAELAKWVDHLLRRHERKSREKRRKRGAKSSAKGKRRKK